MMKMTAGLRVVRGPDWNYGDQDGGEGYVGTVIRLDYDCSHGSYCSVVQSDTVFVCWDFGKDGSVGGVIGNYRVGGTSESHDLRVLDSSPTGIRSTHYCNVCNDPSIVISGTRWTCAECHDYDLCSTCYNAGQHDTAHKFKRFDFSGDTFVEVPARKDSVTRNFFGIYTGATVFRDVQDWLESGQDGGMGTAGKVLTSPPKSSGIVRVLWEENGMVLEHRLGRQGRVDVKCVVPTSGGSYFADHLAILDVEMIKPDAGPDCNGDNDEVAPDAEVPEDEIISTEIPRTGLFDQYLRNLITNRATPLLEFATTTVGDIKRGDRVRVDLERTEFKALQDQPNAGGWSEEMVLCIGELGKVQGTLPTGGIRVEFVSLQKFWIINPQALTMKIFYVGDTLRVSQDKKSVRAKQKGHGGYIQIMEQTLGRVLPVSSVNPDGSKLCVQFNKYTFEMNPWSCCLDKSAAGLEETTPEDQQNEQCINEVKRLIEADVDLMKPLDNRGNTIFHSVVQKSDNSTALRLLLEKGPTGVVDLVNLELITVLHSAVKFGRVNCVQLLVEHKANLNLQDLEGDTPLHCAIIHTTFNREVIHALTSPSNFNFSILNERKFNVLQLAVFQKDAYAVERIIERAPALVDVPLQTDMIDELFGMYPLNIACFHGHTEIVRILVSKGKADLERKSQRAKRSPLMDAVSFRNAATAEFLIKQGADVDTTNTDGNTCLHLILLHLLTTAGAIAPAQQLDESVEIKEIFEQLSSETKDRTWVALICCFVRNGADIHRKNNRLVTPFDLSRSVGSHLVALLEKYHNEAKSRRLPLQRITANDPSSILNVINDGTPTLAQKWALHHKQTMASSSGASGTEGYDNCLNCLRKKALVTFHPCGHKCVCSDCGVDMQKCLECREDVLRTTLDASFGPRR